MENVNAGIAALAIFCVAVFLIRNRKAVAKKIKEMVKK